MSRPDVTTGAFGDRNRQVFGIAGVEVYLQNRTVPEPQVKQPAERVADPIQIGHV